LVEYFYDVFGNLTGVETPNKFIEYKVDGFNRRVSKTIRGSDVTRYIWQDQLRLAAELNADGTLRSQFIYTDGVNSPEYMIKDGVRYYFVKDHRGSVLKVINVGSGEVKQELKYSEFGEVLQDTNPGFQPFGFAGGLYDHDTKLVRFGARDYDGRIGRWLSKDPIRFDGGTPNLYEYAMNDPVNLFDPKGTISQASVTACLGVLAVGEVFDIVSNINKALDQQREVEKKLDDLNEEAKECSSTRKMEITKEKSEILNQYQKDSLMNILDILTPGTGVKAAMGVCGIFLTTF